MKTQNLNINPDDRSEFINKIEKYEFVKDFEEKSHNKTCIEIDCQITSAVKQSVDGSIIGSMGNFRDVTETKRRREEREKLITEFQDALTEVKTLSGLLPIGSYCKKNQR